MKRTLLISIAVLLSISGIVSAEILYEVIDLGLGHANSLNNSGIVGGYGFIWDQVNGRQGVGEGWTYVSENGLVAGSYKPSDVDSRPALWNPTDGVIDIGTVGHRGYATGINNNGVASVWYRFDNTPANSLDAGIWTEGTGLVSLAHLFSGSAASDINNKGQILINGFGKGSYIYDSISQDSIYIGTGRARSMNENGQVIFDDSSAIWDVSTGYHYMNTISGYSQLKGKGLNDIGQVVGNCHDGEWNGTIWDDINGTRLLKDLIDPSNGWYIEYANDINNYGQIVGTGIMDGQPHAILLNPVPEPTTLVLLALGGLLLRRKRNL